MKLVIKKIINIHIVFRNCFNLTIKVLAIVYNVKKF